MGPRRFEGQVVVIGAGRTLGRPDGLGIAQRAGAGAVARMLEGVAAS